MAPSIGEAAQHLLESWSRDDWRAAAKSVTVRRVKPALIFGLAFWAMRKVAELAQFYYKKRTPPPKKKRQKQGWGSIIALLGVLVTIAVGVQAWCYHRYGPLFFWSAESKQLDLTPNAWRALLETRSVGFIGGHHRAGTTQLWRSVARHPEVASFGEQRDCGLDFSEGIFAQDVYPRFGVGEVQDFLGSSSSAQKNTGLGRYALGAVEDVYWTEGHFTVSGHAQARVLNRFGFLWDRHSGLDGAKVLLEKSPPNAVLARYLQALVDWPDHVRAPEKTCAAAADGFPARNGAQYVSRWILLGSRRTSAVAAAAAARSASTPRNVQRSRSDSAGAAQKSSNLILRTCASRGTFDRM